MKSKDLCIVMALIIIVPLFLVSSCNKETFDRETNSYSDEELISGIIFLHGPVSNSIAELNDARVMIDATLIKSMGEKAHKEAMTRQSQEIQNILKISEKIEPGFIAKFANGIRSKNPKIIHEAIVNANKICYMSALVQRYGTSENADRIRHKLDNFHLSSSFSPELTELRSLLSAEKIDEKEIRQKVKKTLFGGDAGKVDDSEVGPPLMTPSDDACLNVALAVNIFFLVNIMSAVNVEIAFNIHQAAAVHTYTAIETEFSHTSKSLHLEQLSASIAKRI